MATYNALHTALTAAVNLILPCAEIKVTMSPNFTVNEGVINGADFRVECLVPVPEAPNLKDILVSFDTPKEREDGSRLDGNEIAGYEIEMLSGCVKARTIDTDQLPSKWTKTICP